MFGFLKNKLKEWVDKAKDTLTPEEIVEETKAEIKEESSKTEPTIKTKSKKKGKTKKAAALSDSKKSELIPALSDSKKSEPTSKIEKVDELIEEAKQKQCKAVIIVSLISWQCHYVMSTEHHRELCKSGTEVGPA